MLAYNNQAGARAASYTDTAGESTTIDICADISLLLPGSAPATTPRHCPLRTSLGARIGPRPLPMDRQIAPVAQTPITADFHQALDVHLDFAAQITLN